MHPSADAVNLVGGDEASPNGKAGDEAAIAVLRILGIPVTGNLGRVLLVQDRIEEGLSFEPRWPSRVAALADKIQLRRTRRPIQDRRVVHRAKGKRAAEGTAASIYSSVRRCPGSDRQEAL